jgi:hypothetical protein
MGSFFVNLLMTLPLDIDPKEVIKYIIIIGLLATILLGLN